MKPYAQLKIEHLIAKRWKGRHTFSVASREEIRSLVWALRVLREESRREGLTIGRRNLVLTQSGWRTLRHLLACTENLSLIVAMAMEQYERRKWPKTGFRDLHKLLQFDLVPFDQALRDLRILADFSRREG